MDEMLQQEIMSRFPYPIARPFRKLRTDECFDPGPNRLRFTLVTAEAVSRFLAAIVLCECRNLLEEGPRELPASFERFGEQFSRPSWGFWQQCIREGLKLLINSGREPLVSELAAAWFSKAPQQSPAATALDELVTLRNQLNHEKLRVMLPHEFERVCRQTFDQLGTALQALVFLGSYRLGFCSGIEVTKKRRLEPTFVHRIKKIAGTSEDFEAARDERSFPLDSPAVLLLGSGSTRHLNLDPLLVYEAEAGAAPDIFFFNGRNRAGEVEYSACNHGGIFQSSKARRQEELEQEANHLVALLSQGCAESTHE